MAEKDKIDFYPKSYLEERNSSLIPLATTSSGALGDKFINFLQMVKKDANMAQIFFNLNFWIKYFQKIILSFHGRFFSNWKKKEANKIPTPTSESLESVM